MKTVTQIIGGIEAVTEVWMVRGDDEVITVPIYTGDDRTPYEMQAGDTVTLTVRREPSQDSPVLMQVTGAPGVNRIPIRHEDTAEIEPGRYSADIQLLTAEGKRHTIWPDYDPADSARDRAKNMKNFVLIAEVTMV